MPARLEHVLVLGEPPAARVRGHGPRTRSSGTGRRSGPPPDAAEQIATAERLGFKSVWMSEAYGSDCFTPLAWWGSATTARAARHRHHPDLGPHPGVDGHDRHHARPPHRRPVHPRPRRERPAGGGGLVRPGVRQAAGPHPRVRRHRASHRRPRQAGRVRGRALPDAPRRRHRLRQAAEVDRAPAAHRHPDLPRRRGPEERGPGRRDLRRLAADVLLAQGRRLLPRRAGRGLRPARRPAARPTTSRWPAWCPRSSATTSRRAPTSCARRSRSTSAAWAPRTGTSTATCSPASATRTPATRSRRRTWPAARTRRPATCPPSMVEDVYLVGPKDKVRDDLEAWRESCVTTMLVSGPPFLLEEIAELVQG